jgi:hypothetical protein
MTADANRLPGYTNVVMRNSSDIAFKSASISIEQGKLGAGWSVDFPELLDISPDDAWTIKVGIAGAEWTRIDGCPAENIAGEDGRNTSSRKVSCSAQSIEIADLRYYCVPKTLVFVIVPRIRNGYAKGRDFFPDIWYAPPNT